MPPADKTEFDLKSLLKAVLDDSPGETFTENLMGRIALLSTAVEFGRLVGVAPMEAASQHVPPVAEEDEGEHDHDEHDGTD